MMSAPARWIAVRLSINQGDEPDAQTPQYFAGLGDR